MFVYRIQHPTDDFGPFNTRGPYGSRGAKFVEFRDCIREFFKRTLVPAVNIIPRVEVCGYSSIEMLKETFDVKIDDDLLEVYDISIENVWKALDYFGFIIVKYASNNWRLCHFDPLQVLFVLAKSNRVQTWRLNEV